MRPEFGNAAICGRRTRGWIVGHFIKGSSLRATDEIEIKVGIHKSGKFTEWKSQPEKKSITLLTSGKFLVQFRSGRKTDVFKLSSPGDFVIWEDEREHRWKALTKKATVITIRWPSITTKIKRR